MIETVVGQTTVNVTVLVSVVNPPSAVMVYVAVHVPFAVVGIVIVLSVAAMPVPEATCVIPVPAAT